MTKTASDFFVSLSLSLYLSIFVSLDSDGTEAECCCPALTEVTHTMIFGKSRCVHSLKMYGQDLEFVDGYKYLGMM